MTECDCYRICRIVRLRRGLERKYSLYHVYDLALLRTAIAYDRLLHLKRRILEHRQSSVVAGQQDHASALCHGDAGRDIRIEKEFLYRSYVRLKGPYDLAHIRIYPVKAAREARPRLGRYDAAANETLLAPV